jgi:hypothetical protein
VSRYTDHQKRWLPLAAALLTLLLGFLYILSAPPQKGAGLPMDDSYIHLDYARNLALYGELAFNHGTASAGTSSLGWDLLLAPTFWLGFDPLWWAMLLSLVCQALAGWWFARLMLRLVEGSSMAEWTPTLAVLLFAGSGILLWYGTSGMETSLFLAFCLIALVQYDRGKKIAAAVWCGAGVFIRFEALLLALVIFLFIFFATKEGVGKKLRQSLPFALIPPLFYVPALITNLLAEGTPWPGTFQGRVMLLAQNFTLFDPTRLPEHFNNLAIFLHDWFLGVSFQNLLPASWSLPIDLIAIFLPVIALGLVGMFIACRRGNGSRIEWIFVCWALLTVLVIGSILPLVIYAGRYEAMLVVLLLWGIAWAVGWIVKALSTRLSRSGFIAAVVLLLLGVGFWQVSGTIIWMQIRTLSVNHIANVHVKAGYFCHILPTDKTIAVFDVGAVKYLNPQREIVDWAGLTDAAMRRAIREGSGADYLRNSNVGYIAVMEHWNREVHPYPFDLANEVRAGNFSLEYDFPSERGVQPLPSFATPPEHYLPFIQAVLIAADRMSFYRVVW